jgi:microcystin degradation protein MlrC
MRIAVGGIYHESNTFIAQPMTLARFSESQLHYGADILPNWRGTCSEMAGFFEGANRFGFEAIPTLMAWGMPSGTVTNATFESLSSDLVARLRLAAPLEGVLLSIHGAMVSEKYPDADGEILRRVREAIGPDVPLVATFDLHANLTEEMVRWPNALIGYKTYPHIDQVDRAIEAASIMHRMLREGLRPHIALARRPLFPHILSQSTDQSPMAEIIAATRERESRPGIVSVSAAVGFPYTDVPHAGFAVLAVGETPNAARSAAESLADLVWQQRVDFTRKLPSPAAAVSEAISTAEGLTVLVDVGDNVGAGTPGDGTVLLSELLRQKARGALVMLCDAEACAASIAAGVRQEVTLRVGGKCDRHHGQPVQITARVRVLSDGKFRNIGPLRDGVPEDQGRTAVLDTGGVLVVLTERRMPMWNLQQLRALGIEPVHLRIIVVKAAIAYRAAYSPIAAKIIEADTPGLSAADVRQFHYSKLERPVYPLDAL